MLHPQLRGYNLLPFHFDKQLLLLGSVYDIFVTAQIPIARMNISDWGANEAATQGTRCEDGNIEDRERQRS